MDNVYADPYVPDFAKRRPRIQQQVPATPVYKPQIYDQIQSVLGFEGAREFANTRLSNGASCIIAEGDPNLARVYVVAKDQNGSILLSGYRLTPEEEPKPITMQDISEQLADIQNRITKLEEKKVNDDEPVHFTTGATTVPAIVDKPKVSATDSAKSSKIPGSNGSN